MLNFSKLITGIALVICSLNGIASPQIPDLIIYRGDTIAMYNLLVEVYLQAKDTTAANRLFGLSFREGASTNCWRGYQAIYQVDGNQLFVVAVTSCGEWRRIPIDQTASIARMRAIFGDRVVDGRVLVDWYSGDLSFPLNNKIIRWDGVFFTTYEKERVLRIVDGTVMQVNDVVNYEDDPKRIDRMYRNSIHRVLFKKLKKARWKSSDECDCSESYVITIDENGEVSRIIMKEYITEEEINAYWDRDEYDYCIKNIENALHGLQFDIIRRRGTPVAEDVYLQIWVTEKGKLENWTD